MYTGAKVWAWFAWVYGFGGLERWNGMVEWTGLEWNGMERPHKLGSYGRADPSLPQ